MSFTITEGFADEITDKKGRKHYTGIGSLKSHDAKEKGLKVKAVKYKGCCIYANINDRAHDSTPFPIEIDGVSIYNFIDSVAKPYEELAV